MLTRQIDPAREAKIPARWHQSPRVRLTNRPMLHLPSQTSLTATFGQTMRAINVWVPIQGMVAWPHDCGFFKWHLI